MCFILFAYRFLNKVLKGIKTFFNRIKTITMLRNLLASRIKCFYSVENHVDELCCSTEFIFECCLHSIVNLDFKISSNILLINEFLLNTNYIKYKFCEMTFIAIYVYVLQKSVGCDRKMRLNFLQKRDI